MQKIQDEIQSIQREKENKTALLLKHYSDVQQAIFQYGPKEFLGEQAQTLGFSPIILSQPPVFPSFHSPAPSFEKK
jgi:hypothetical protein